MSDLPLFTTGQAEENEKLKAKIQEIEHRLKMVKVDRMVFMEKSKKLESRVAKLELELAENVEGLK